MKKSGSGTTPIHDYPLTYAIVIISVLTRRVTLTFSDGKPLPSLSYNSTIQSGSLSSITQKWFLPFSDVRKTLLPLCCSMMHCALLLIRLAKRFFAFLEIGVTSAVFMNLDVDVCNLDDDAGLVEIMCATRCSGTSRRVSEWNLV